MGFLQLKSCCCGFPLKSGALMIAIFEVVFCSLAFISQLRDEFKATSNEVMDLGLPIIFMLFSVFLLVGVLQEKHVYIACWLIIQAVMILMTAIATVICFVILIFVDEDFINSVFDKEDLKDLELFDITIKAMVVIMILVGAFVIYCWLVIHSFYRSLQPPRYSESTCALTSKA